MLNPNLSKHTRESHGRLHTRTGNTSRTRCSYGSTLALNLQRKTARSTRSSASEHDLVSEISVHMLVLGPCYGIVGYADPRSNREEGLVRYDPRVEPVDVAPGSPESWTAAARRPHITIETKFAKAAEAPEDEEGVDLGHVEAHEAEREQLQAREQRDDADERGPADHWVTEEQERSCRYCRNEV